MKQVIKNIIIIMLFIAVLVAAVLLVHTKVTLALIVFLQIATLLAIGGINLKDAKHDGKD